MPANSPLLSSRRIGSSKEILSIVLVSQQTVYYYPIRGARRGAVKQDLSIDQPRFESTEAGVESLQSLRYQSVRHTSVKVRRELHPRPVIPADNSKAARTGVKAHHHD
jgi:hypothetical protein